MALADLQQLIKDAGGAAAAAKTQQDRAQAAFVDLQSRPRPRRTPATPPRRT